MHLRRLHLAIDRAIGEGTLIACIQDAQQAQISVEIHVAGSLQSEAILAKALVGWLQVKHPDLNPVAVRLVKLFGTWQEAVQWTGNWYRTEDLQTAPAA